MSKQVNCIGRNMSIINKYLKIFLKGRFKDIGLASSDVMILLIINSSDGISQEGIIEHLGYDKAVITRRIKQLLEAEYISRKRAAEDKRSYTLRLSSKGQDLMPLIFKNLDEWNALITEGIPAETVKLVSEKIAIIARNAVATQHGEK